MQNIRENEQDRKNDVPVGFFPRLVAYLMDLLLVGAVLGVVKIPLVVTSWFVGDIFWSQPILFTFNLLDIGFYALGVIYFIVFTYYSGSTLGKKLMKIHVVSTEGKKLTLLQVVYRETIGRFLSGFLMELGYLLVLVDGKKEGLHDKLAGTQVVYYKMVQVVSCMPIKQEVHLDTVVEEAYSNKEVHTEEAVREAYWNQEVCVEEVVEQKEVIENVIEKDEIV